MFLHGICLIARVCCGKLFGKTNENAARNDEKTRGNSSAIAVKFGGFHAQFVWAWLTNVAQNVSSSLQGSDESGIIFFQSQNAIKNALQEAMGIYGGGGGAIRGRPPLGGGGNIENAYGGGQYGHYGSPVVTSIQPECDCDIERGAANVRPLKIVPSRKRRLFTGRPFPLIHASSIDKYSRIMFPMTALVLNALYWTTYIHVSRKQTSIRTEGTA